MTKYHLYIRLPMPRLHCYKIVMNTKYGSFPVAVTVCKDCLKELQKQIKEQIDD